MELQANGVGFALIEVLAECPLYLGLEPPDAESWVRDEMSQVFPLGVKKDATAEGATYPPFRRPSFDAATLLAELEATIAPPERFGATFPAHLDEADVSLKLAGSGGDGAQTAAMVIARCAANEGFDATHIPSYGPQSRGGTSYADVHVARDEVLSPASPHPHVLVAFNAPSLAKFGPSVRPGGTILYDSSVIPAVPDLLETGVRLVAVPFSTLAVKLGAALVKNVVALGALQEATGLFPPETFLSAIRAALRNKTDLLALNEAAFEAGRRVVR